MNLTEEKIECLIKESFVRNHIPIERCSTVLFSQLVHMPEYGGMNSPFQFVEREIAHLEGFGKTQTKPATAFSSKGKLRGFWHKHFLVPGYGHLGINTKVAWGMHKDGLGRLPDLAVRLENPNASHNEILEEARKASLKIAREIIYGKGGFIQRLENEKGTGDWLIFNKHQGKNYYLCIAKHNEDDFILQALRNCISDFPFISFMSDN